MKILKDENLNVTNARYEIECTLDTRIRKSASRLITEKLFAIGDIQVDLIQTD
jgi:hypothetical protein